MPRGSGLASIRRLRRALGRLGLTHHPTSLPHSSITSQARWRAALALGAAAQAKHTGPWPPGFGRFGGDSSRNEPQADAEGGDGSRGAEAEQKESGAGPAGGSEGDGGGFGAKKSEQGGGSGGGGQGGPGGERRWGGGYQELALLAVLALFMGLPSRGDSPKKEVSFREFVWEYLAKGLVERIEVVEKTTVRVYLKQEVPMEVTDTPALDHEGIDGSQDYTHTPQPAPSAPAPVSNGAGNPRYTLYFTIGSLESFERRLEDVQATLGFDPDDYVPVSYTSETSFFAEFAKLLPTIALAGIAFFMMRNALGGGGIPGAGGRNIFQVGKANPTIIKQGDAAAKKMSFADVAGLDEAKVEVMEFVDFLKNPSKYEALGAKIPRGALLVGPPGTGKTLLAKATAGEASVPFFSMSGSDFIEMFVGVGPSRVRDLFSQARQNAPCIVFIDEIDAVGRARGRGGFSGGNDERENTLNAILVEMDGFSTSSGVVVLAGTNRADILDKALLRPGRFDRQISIDRPDIRGRFQIFRVHLKPLKLTDSDLDSVAKRLAAMTPGFAGADIANLCNEAALIAARNGKDSIDVEDFESANDRVIGGLEKKTKVISPDEKNIVAHHEAGHAVAGWFLKHADPLMKVSIIPRGSAALGFAQYLPQDRFLRSEEQIEDFMVMALGGRVAEDLIFNSVTTGAQDDLMRVTRAAYAQITTYGMNERVGTVNFPTNGQQGSQFYKPYSEETAEMIDREAQMVVERAYKRCQSLLSEKINLVRSLAERLLQKEVVREPDLVEILGERPFSKPADYDTFVTKFEEDRKRRLARDKRMAEEKEAQAVDPGVVVPGVA